LKILMIDKYYFIKGGAERYFFELAKIFESKGHEVIPFSMKHPQNYETSWEKYFVDNIDFNPESKFQKVVTGIRSMVRITYSIQAKKRMERLLDKVKPDVAHLHMIDHQISPSILPVLKSRGIPVIQTVHTYKPVCPSYRLYNMGKNEICEKCLDGNYYHAIIEKCHKGSYAASFMLAFEMYVHKWLGLYTKNIDLYHVPSMFMGQKLVQGGIEKDKIHHLFYTIDLNSYPVRYDSDDYFVYYGRLSAEKGVPVLLKAFSKVKKQKLKIIGTGPEEKNLKKLSEELGLNKWVEFTGPVYGDELKKIVSGAQFVVVPSEWYDNSPLVMYESLAMGKPVIGSNMGGIPELIKNGEDGYIFEQGNVDELMELLGRMIGDKTHLAALGKAARVKAEKIFDPDMHYNKMISFYQAAGVEIHSS